jgi:hypothetical protein
MWLLLCSERERGGFKLNGAVRLAENLRNPGVGPDRRATPANHPANAPASTGHENAPACLGKAVSKGRGRHRRAYLIKSMPFTGLNGALTSTV